MIKKLVNFLVIALIYPATITAQSVDSPIKNDEVVLFLPSVGYPLIGGDQWKLHVHGWIYEPDLTSDVSMVFRKLFGLGDYQLKEEKYSSITEERRKLFFVDNESGKHIPIQVGSKTVVSEGSGDDGHFYLKFQLSAQEIEQWRDKKTSALSFSAITRENDQRKFPGKIYLLDAQGLSVVSDIDDTIKISEVYSKEALFNNTFYKPFVPVPKIADFYQQIAKKANNITFHYVSGSPWQLYPSLSKFLDEYHFPQGSFHLRFFHWQDGHFSKQTQEHKLETIEFLFQKCPQRHFILVGDSSEHDAEIYAQFARKYAERVVHIFIREVRRAEGDKLNYSEIFKGLPQTQWTVFTQAENLSTGFLDTFSRSSPR